MTRYEVFGNKHILRTVKRLWFFFVIGHTIHKNTTYSLTSSSQYYGNSNTSGTNTVIVAARTPPLSEGCVCVERGGNGEIKTTSLTRTTATYLLDIVDAGEHAHAPVVDQAQLLG